MHLSKTPLLAAVILMLCGGSAAASGPVAATFTGCVVDGLMISTKGYWYKPIADNKRPFDASKHEGKRIEVSGSLYPGDRFLPDPSTLKVGKKCPLTKNKKFRSAWAWANRGAARSQLSARKFNKALSRIDKAIAIDATVYAFFLTRAKIRLAKGDLDVALSDAKHALSLAADKTERDWCKAVIKTIEKQLAAKP